jgi:heat shock protein HslJ
VDWRLIALDGQAPRIIRLPTLIVAGDRLNGFGGCTTYTGSIEEPAPGEIVVSPLNRTPTACPPAETKVEQEFLPRLEKVDRYTFFAGQLALSGVYRQNRFQLLLKAYPSRGPENSAR